MSEYFNKEKMCELDEVFATRGVNNGQCVKISR